MIDPSHFSGPQGEGVDVEVGYGAVFVRDRKEADLAPRGLLAFRLEEWQAFLDGGDSDVQIEEVDGQFHMRNRRELRTGYEQQVLRFARQEWEVFTAGLEAGDFNLRDGGATVPP